MSNLPSPGLISVIVVTANSGTTLLPCAEGILRSTVAIELLIVDNASTDGAVLSLNERYSSNPQVKFIYNKKNLGFGAAAHQGAEQAYGDVLLFLNPDCYLMGDTIAELRSLLIETNDAGLIGACMLDADGKPARVNRRREPTLRRCLMTLSGLARWEKKYPALAGIEIPKSIGLQPGEAVEAVSGALMLMPRSFYHQIGGFDREYFLHCEDLDLCRRVRDAGFKVVFASNIRVTHVQGSSSHNRPVFVSWHKHRGMWRYFRKFDAAARNPLLRLLVWSGIWLHFLLFTPIHLRKDLQDH